jgi:hypothetical protein
LSGETLGESVMGKDKKNNMESKKQKKQRIGKTRR